jgi:hypothetical protein
MIDDAGQRSVIVVDRSAFTITESTSDMTIDDHHSHTK